MGSLSMTRYTPIFSLRSFHLSCYDVDPLVMTHVHHAFSSVLNVGIQV